MKKSTTLAAAAISLLTLAPLLSAVTTDPVGAQKIDLPAESDTIVALGFTRSAVFEGTVSSVSGDVISVSGTPVWTSNQYQNDPGVQDETYYVLMLTGNREGMYYTVTANGTDTLTVDAAGDDIATEIVADDRLQIIPFWTFASLFPDQVGITTTTSISGAGAGTEILLLNASASGVDNSPTESYYYYSGASFGGEGWRRKGGGFTTIRNYDILLPDIYFVFRNATEAASEIVVAGNVQMAGYRTVVGTITDGEDQDNSIALTIPVELTLAESRLFEEGIVVGTASISGAGAEELLVFNNSQSGFDKSPAESYYYYTGASFGGAGWRKKGGGFTNIFNDQAILQPGQGFIIRKIADGPASSSVWSVVPPYLQ